jgi:two-component system sensor histidine kinase KdpD
MRTGRGTVGVVGIDREVRASALSPEERRLLNALSDQAALAIERVRLAEDLDRAQLAAEADRLRAALSASISHDLRTPLASILGSATSLRAHENALTPEARAALIRTIQEEAERLNRFIGNLLDMTRLEAGRMTPEIGLVDLSDAVGAALRRAEKLLAGHRVRLDLPPDLPMVAIDAVLFEQVLFNILDNAAKHAPAGTEITLSARRQDGRVRIAVMDEGQGIPPSDLPRIFDKFYRASDPDRRRVGTGLGLAICRGFIEAMGGRIEAANRTDRSGAVFTLDLPAAEGARLEALAAS